MSRCLFRQVCRQPLTQGWELKLLFHDHIGLMSREITVREKTQHNCRSQQRKIARLFSSAIESGTCHRRLRRNNVFHVETCV